MLKSKINSIVLAIMIGVSSVHAQDDVSIMDLKEIVYLLMKDVQKMKKKEQKVLGEVKSTSTLNIADIKAMKDRINALEQENKELRNKEVISTYKVATELKNYKNNQE